MRKTIFLADIDLKTSFKTRHHICDETVKDYAAAYKSKDKLPEPVLFEVDGDYLIADGYHRISALKANGVKVSTFEVKVGTMQEALKFALSCNTHHGLKRTGADKRQCVETAVKAFPSSSNNQIAEMCSVGDDLVKSVRVEMEQSGKVKPVKERIDTQGRKQSATKPRSGNETPKGKNEDTDSVPSTGPGEDTGKTEARVELDETGYPIPPKALEAWSKRGVVKELLAQISAVKSVISKAHEEEDVTFVESRTNSLLLDIDRLYGRLKMSMPYAVCLACQGQLTEKCKNCSGRGVTSQFKYDTGDKDLKKVREKSCKK